MAAPALAPSHEHKKARAGRVRPEWDWRAGNRPWDGLL